MGTKAKYCSALMALLFICVAGSFARAQTNQVIYDEALQNGWQNWSWATTNLANSSPTHTGSRSISVSAQAWQALYLHHDAFDNSLYTSLNFWIHGGPSGGQRLQVQGLLNGSAQTAVAIGPLAANTWSQVTVNLSSLGVANKPNMDGFWIQDTTGTTQPTWYIDDIQMVAAGPPATVNVTVNAGAVIRSVDSRMFGVNAAIWDSAFNTATTVNLLTENGNQVLRFPGGSASDDYHWATNKSGNNTWTWATSFDSFANVAVPTGAKVYITVNYGSGTATEAANWVQYSNVTKGYGFKYWEIGNENYGSWENDTHAIQHDPYTYGTLAKDYINQMKAKDGTIKVGVVVETGEDSYANNTNHPATNPRTNQVHNGWTPVLLTTFKNLGVTPDFIIYHKYAQNAGGESDQGLLSSSGTWAGDVADLRQQLNDYLGAAGASVEIVCTENNSVSSGPGKQTTSLVNGLFMADSIGQALKTELNGLIWWDMRNGQDTANNNNSSLYGWRLYGDYGIVSTSSERYPVFYVSKLLSHLARGGDSVVSASSDYSLVAAYAAKRLDGTLSLLLINKSSINAFSTNISVNGFTPVSTATVFSYGIPQDDAVRTSMGSPDVQQTSINNAGASFTYSVPAYSATIFSLSPNVGTPPAAPSGLNAAAVTRNRIDLSWTDNSNNETAFIIERSRDGTNFSPIASVGANVKYFSNTGLTRNTLYFYRVKAHNASGDSTYSNIASAQTPK